MRRAAIERPRTIREWQGRLEIDSGLEPGRFRKGRTARGCPQRCAHCRAIKSHPARQEQRADLVEAEGLRDDPA